MTFFAESFESVFVYIESRGMSMSMLAAAKQKVQEQVFVQPTAVSFIRFCLIKYNYTASLYWIHTGALYPGYCCDSRLIFDVIFGGEGYPMSALMMYVQSDMLNILPMLGLGPLWSTGPSASKWTIQYAPTSGGSRGMTGCIPFPHQPDQALSQLLSD